MFVADLFPVVLLPFLSSVRLTTRKGGISQQVEGVRLTLEEVELHECSEEHPVIMPSCSSSSLVSEDYYCGPGFCPPLETHVDLGEEEESWVVVSSPSRRMAEQRRCRRGVLIRWGVFLCCCVSLSLGVASSVAASSVGEWEASNVVGTLHGRLEGGSLRGANTHWEEPWRVEDYRGILEAEALTEERRDRERGRELGV